MGVLDDLAESVQDSKPTTSSNTSGGGGALGTSSSSSSTSSSKTSTSSASSGAGSAGSNDKEDDKDSDSGALSNDWWSSVTGGVSSQGTADKGVSSGSTSSGAGSVGSSSASSTASSGDSWADYGRFLESLSAPSSAKADDVGPGQDPDSDMAWVSFVNWLATQQSPAEPTTDPYWSSTGDRISSPVGSEPTTRTVTTVPVEPTSGSDLYNYLVQMYGPSDTWSDELWQTLETNLGVVRPDAAPADSAADKSQAFESTDPNWSAFQDMLHQPSEETILPPASTTSASGSPLYDYLVSMYGPEETWSDDLWKTLNENLGITKPGGTSAKVMPPSEPIPGVSSAERDPTLGANAPYVPTEASVPLPRPRPDPAADLTWEPATTGETTPLDEGEKTTGDPWQQLRTGEDTGSTEGLTTGGLDAAAESEPSTYDKVIDNAGKLLSKTGIGYIVSTLFPDVWNAGGDMMKSLDDGGMGTLGGEGEPGTYWDPATGTWVGGGQDTPKTGKKTPTDAGTTTPPPVSFPDVNKNGVDDRLEPPFYDPYGDVVFPDIPPYRPGYDDEWLYFRQKMAQGGVVGYADGGEVSMLTNPDPRVGIIADAEDALQNMAQGAPEKDDALAIKKFVDMFGPDALRQLQTNVAQGMKIRPTGGRMVVGPGGPTDDAIPAVIDGTQPAALSSGEFVLPADAVAAAGNGDPVAGAEQLQQLSEALSQRAT